MLNNNVIIIHFPAYSGGKFIGNCLALSKHCVPMHEKHASYLLDNPMDYGYRLQCHIDIMKNEGDWRDAKEFHEPELLGHEVYNKWKNGEEIDSSKMNNTTNAILNSDVNFVIVTHSVNGIKTLSKVWRDATVVSLINVEEFWNIAFPLKRQILIDYDDKFMHYGGNYNESHYNLLRGDDWPAWDEFEQVCYNIEKLPNNYPLSIVEEIKTLYDWYTVDNDVITFNMSGSIFSRKCFLNAIEILYKQLGYTDYNPNLVSTYWEEYVKFHGVENFDLC